jgi:hypothetical protein
MLYQDELPFDFSRISADHKLAIFSQEKNIHKTDDLEFGMNSQTELSDLEQYNDKDDSDRIVLPLHEVKIRTMVQDTPIPPVTIDFDKGEISLEWRLLYSAFFQEIAAIKEMGNNIARIALPQAGLMRDAVAGGRLTMEAAITQVFQMMSNAEIDIHKEVRKARIKRQYEKWLIGREGELSFDEYYDAEIQENTLENLKQARFYASMGEFSDDDENDDDEDDDRQYRDEDDDEEGEEEEDDSWATDSNNEDEDEDEEENGVFEDSPNIIATNVTAGL